MERYQPGYKIHTQQPLDLRPVLNRGLRQVLESKSLLPFSFDLVEEQLEVKNKNAQKDAYQNIIDACRFTEEKFFQEPNTESDIDI